MLLIARDSIVLRNVAKDTLTGPLTNGAVGFFGSNVSDSQIFRKQMTTRPCLFSCGARVRERGRGRSLRGRRATDRAQRRTRQRRAGAKRATPDGPAARARPATRHRGRKNEQRQHRRAHARTPRQSVAAPPARTRAHGAPARGAKHPQTKRAKTTTRQPTKQPAKRTPSKHRDTHGAKRAPNQPKRPHAAPQRRPDGTKPRIPQQNTTPPKSPGPGPGRQLPKPSEPKAPHPRGAHEHTQRAT